MYARAAKPKARATLPTQKKSSPTQDTDGIDHRIGAIQGKIIQKQDPPTTSERTKSAEVGDRHAIPHPYMDLGSWYKTLMTGRVADLYTTTAGFLGHAQQVQQELDRLSPLIDEKSFHDPVSLQTAIDYENSIKHFIVSESIKSAVDFPKFIFQFSGNSAVSVEKTAGKFKGG